MGILKKTGLAMFLVILLTSSMLAGCGSSESESTDIPESVSTDTVATDTTGPSPDFQMLKIVGKTKADVDSELGEPNEFGPLDNGTYSLSSGESIPATKGIYIVGDFELEIAYLDDTAQLITVFPKSGKYNFPDDIDSFFDKIGLPKTTSTTDNSSFARWENTISDVYEVSVFSEDAKIYYLYAIVNEKYR